LNELVKTLEFASRITDRLVKSMDDRNSMRLGHSLTAAEIIASTNNGIRQLLFNQTLMLQWMLDHSSELHGKTKS
jgi:hypothetical protein